MFTKVISLTKIITEIQVGTEDVIKDPRLGKLMIKMSPLLNSVGAFNRKVNKSTEVAPTVFGVYATVTD
jgi:hypothetical protein